MCESVGIFARGSGDVSISTQEGLRCNHRIFMNASFAASCRQTEAGSKVPDAYRTGHHCRPHAGRDLVSLRPAGSFAPLRSARPGGLWYLCRSRPVGFSLAPSVPCDRFTTTSTDVQIGSFFGCVPSSWGTGGFFVRCVE